MHPTTTRIPKIALLPSQIAHVRRQRITFDHRQICLHRAWTIENARSDIVKPVAMTTSYSFRSQTGDISINGFRVTHQHSLYLDGGKPYDTIQEIAAAKASRINSPPANVRLSNMLGAAHY